MIGRYHVIPAVALLLAGCAGADPWTQEEGQGEENTASESQPFLSFLPGYLTHEDITQVGLYFLDPDVAEDLGEDNEETDTPFSDTVSNSAYHFDNCRFAETTASIRARYDDTVNKIGNGLYEEAREQFGTILHTVQDFYAHSNWVDDPAQDELFAAHTRFEYPSLKSGDPVGSPMGSMVVLQLLLPAGFDNSWNGRLPAVTTPWGDSIGLITGVYEGNDDVPACPADAIIPHGAFDLSVDDDEDPNTYLTKDPPGALHRDEAVAMATDATTLEFCRLARLVLLRRGKARHDALLDAWGVHLPMYVGACGVAGDQVSAVTNGYLW